MAKNFLKIFSPKDDKFFKLFEQASENINVMGKKLSELSLETNAETRLSLIAQIQTLEKENDNITHTIFIELGKNFITPLDREDIHALASALDDVADNIYACSKKINFYKITYLDKGIQEFATVVMHSVVEVKNIISQLRKLQYTQSIKTSIEKINTLENQADDIFDIYVESMFANEKDAIEIIKKKEIYQILEETTDMCEDVANVVESILIKYA